MAEQDTPPPTITAMKIPIIKKGEYDIWSMRMRQYICHTDHNLWDIIVNGDLQEEPAPTGDQSGPSAPPVPKTAKQLAAKRNQERVKSILLLAIPDEYLLKFHNVPDAKSLWEAIKSRFGGNEESKKMQKNVLKHQFENFTTAPNESLDKAYDRFQKLISQLEVYAAPVSKEDINQKFLRSLPPSWSQIALIMRNKPDIDQTDIDDLYNNLRVYEDEMKRSSSSTSNSQNLAFLSSENTSRTNEVSTASGNFGVNTAGGTNSSSQVSSTPGADEVVCSFFAQQTTSPPLDNEDLQQIDQDDLEELDIRWQVAMLTVRVQRFIKKTGRNLDFKGKQPVTFDKSQVECYNCHRKGHFAKECKSGWNQGKRSYGDNGRRNATTNEPSSQALVAQDGLGGYDWSNDFDEPVNYALMAISSSSSSSSSDNEVQKCSKQCLESFKTLQKNYDSEREKHSRARLEIQGYELALESLESRILGHEKNELAWGEKYEFQNYELKCRELKINNLNMELEKVVKERDELKLKIEKWEESSKNLDELLNSQMSARDKTGLGYGTQLNEMSNNSETDSEISLSVFDVRSSDEESTPANDRFSKADGYHVVPPPITRNFLTPRANISFVGLDDYAIRKKIIKSKTTELNADTSKSKTSETVGNTNEVNVEKPKSVNESVVSTPKINKDKVIIDDWNSDDENDVSEVSPVKTNETQTAKTQVDKIGQTSKKAGIGFKKIKACFVCLITPIKQNKKRAVHKVSNARPVSIARPVSTVRPFAPKIAQTSGAIRPIYTRMDNVRPRGSYSPIKRSYYTKPALRPKDLKQDVKNFGVQNMTTAGTRAVVNTGKGKMVTDLKKSRWVWRPKGHYLDHVSKDSGSFMLKKVKRQSKILLKDQTVVAIVVSPSHMTGNKALSFKLLDESQVVHRAPRKDDVYSLDLKNIIPSGESINKKRYCLVVTDDFSRFSSVFFLATKDEFYASIRSDLLFDDADGIDSMPNQAIFDAIQLMGHLDAKKKFVMYPRFISVFLDKQLKNVPVPLDHFPINALTSKVFSFMVKKGKHFSGNVTPLFESMLVQPTKDEGEASERQSEPQPTPFPPLQSADQYETQPDPSPRPSPTILDSIPEGSGGNHRDQAKEIKHLKAHIKKLKKKAKPVITHHKAWMKSVSMKQRLAGKKSLKTKWMQKESVSKQGRKPAKAEPTVHKDLAFDDLDDIVDDAIDYMESEDAQDEGRTSSVVLEEKESTQKGVTKPKEVKDDETIVEFLVSMSQNKAKQKGVEIKDAEDSDRPRATSTRSVLTLKPLPKIDPKDKGKKVLEEEAESDAESEGVDEAERKFDQLAKDEEIARKVQEDWEAEEEMKKLVEEEATKAALIQDFDDIQTRIEPDRLLAARLQEKEKHLQLKREPNFFMILLLLKGGGKKHADLKNKNFEEIQVLYKKVKRSDKDFIAIGSAEDERQIKEMNEESKDPKKKRLKKRVVNETPREEDTAKVPAEQEVTEQGTKKRKSGHVKMIARKRPRPQPDDDSDDEHRKCLRIVTFDSTIDSEIMETKSFVSKLHKVSSPDGDYLVVYRVNGHFRAFNYLMEQYSEITPEGIELILWGDLKIMMESSTEENDQELKDGIVIYMLVERRYPLSKELLQRMLDLGLEVEEESTATLYLDQTVPVQKQTAFGKDKSNPLIADSLLKTIRLSIHLVVYNKELAIPEQMTTSKGISNPLMPGSLPKTTKPA
ncbi:ribonuclease H-like domain-containing protein [Tanacetum coccineum]|uniref:Ribonuclease H-like domain-containing protein n=1 Tax=Tanacetum coccineum TaxID=301880 RepID=A0ABQ5I9Y5_9ASTR